MCGSSMARVRGVMAASMARTSTPGSVKGTGNDTSLTTMPSRRARCFHVVTMRA